ncbi:MAG: type III secretion system inner rod subunit SctI [Pseudomonadota bacterium]
MSHIVSINPIANRFAGQTIKPQSEGWSRESLAKDVDRFEKALSSRSGRETVSAGPEPLPQTAPPRTDESTPTLGDAILQGIEKMKADHENRVRQIENNLEEIGDQPMTTQNMMKLQFDLMKLNVQQEVVSKVADKTTQGIQTLFKNQ